jgi:hypothetical protein
MTPGIRPHSRTAAVAMPLVAMAVSAACSDDPGDIRVGADVTRVTATLTCVANPEHDKVMGVSPDGDLWLSNGAITRIVDVNGAIATPPGRIDDVTALQPWNATAASAIIAGEVWALDRGGREFVSTPLAFGAARGMCGAASVPHGGFVATEGGLVERSADVWWQWLPSASDSFGSIRELGRIDGACASDDDALWLVNDAGALWRVTPDRASVVSGSAVAIDEIAIVPGAGIATRSAGELAIGPTWQRVLFDAGLVSHIASSGDRLWAIAGGATYVRTVDGWLAVDGLPSAPTKIRPDAAGGAWLEYSDQVCRAALTPAIRLSGIRPFERHTDAVGQLRVTPPSDATGAVTVERDGAMIASANLVDGVATMSDLDLGAVGWHDLTIRAGAASRLLTYNQVQISDRSWATDVQPIFMSTCAGTRCHGPTPIEGRVDLSTYDAWRTKAGRIRERLLRGEMPPSGARPSADTIDIVLDWIEGGLQP